MDRTLTVSSTALNRPEGGVTRLTFDGGAAVVDVPVALVRFDNGDAVRVTVWAHGDPAPDWCPDLMMRGTVYSATTDDVHVSFGGLLARIPTGDVQPRVGSDVHLALTAT